jgi:hypothetical protein
VIRPQVKSLISTGLKSLPSMNAISPERQMLFSETVFLNFVFSESMVAITLISFMDMVLDSVLTAELYIPALSCPLRPGGSTKKAERIQVAPFPIKD